MQITAQDVQKLRERTGAGMMDCKKALKENMGDFDKAIEFLRKKGIASAAKKAGRTAKEGMVTTWVDSKNQSAVMVEVNCETDFVGKNDSFKAFAEGVAQHIAEAKPATTEELIAQKYCGDTSKTIEEFVKGAIATMGENIQIRRFSRFELTPNNTVASYVHMGGKVGVLVEFKLGDASKSADAKFEEYSRDVAMHIAAAAPQFLQSSEVPADVIAKEKDIFVAQMKDQNKPADVLEKIAAGKINKYFEEICLLNQKFVKDDKKTIQALTTEVGKALGTDLAIAQFSRFVLGEGVVAGDEE